MMFQISKIVGGLLDPIMLFTLLLGIVIWMARSDNYQTQNSGLKWLSCLFWLLIAAAILPVGQWAMVPLDNYFAQQKLPDRVDGIVLLTGDENPRLSEERGLPQAGSAASRYLHLAVLARRYPQAQIIVAGTTDSHYKPREMTTQQVSAAMIEAVGLRADRIQYETKSRTTHENAVNVVEMVQPKPESNWVVITSGYHMPRSVLTFKKAGMQVIPSVSDYQSGTDIDLIDYPALALNLCTLRTVAHEYFGLLAYWYYGWIDTPWK
ncbi:MAG: YdcF family protein [Alphaproteobacteria bacterium]|nr:YdcF family protein [Alphaproteobacteria bacterium]